MPPPPSSRFTKPALAIWCLTLAIVLFARILGPSDLGQNLDQSKTIAFTLDMVNHHQWILPRDSLGELTRKPPMINWLGVPIVALGFHNELALKLPAVLSGISTTILVFFSARFLFGGLSTDIADEADRSIATHATPLAMLAAGAWLASPSAIKHIYFMRPDILLTTLLIGGWLCAIRLLDIEHPPSRPRRVALLMWGLGASAVLTKGPFALILPIYLAAHLLLITPKAQRKACLARTGWHWGLVLMLVIPLLWLGAAYRIDPDHVAHTLLGHELGARLGAGGMGGVLRAMIQNPGYFFERFLPWSIPMLLAMVFPPSSKLRSHPMGPAGLWVIVVLSVTTLSAMNSGSYTMPAYPAGAILGVYALFRLLSSKSATRILSAMVVIAATLLVSALLITFRETTQSRGAINLTGEHIKAFSGAAAREVGSQGVKFHAMGDLPVASLMGRHQPGEIEPDPSLHWLIQPTDVDPRSIPMLTSEPIVTHDPITGEPTEQTITIGLYKVPNG